MSPRNKKKHISIKNFKTEVFITAADINVWTSIHFSVEIV
jgi:hypothetical protein